jgi:GMP synthase-like glutamine amidotransferase
VVLEATLRRVRTVRGWVAIQHVPFEGPGLIAAELERLGLPLRICRVYEGESLPDPGEIAGLVVMGGPMGVGDKDEHPYLTVERELISATVAATRPVLGVCLGAQLLADALGARVFTGPAPEIGPGTVALTEAGRADRVLGAAGSPTVKVVHWHQDTFELPPGAVWLASSDLYPHQGFRHGPLAYGLQFHVEVDARLAAGWREHLPAGVELPEATCAEVERSGRAILRAFFELARDPAALSASR